MADDRPKLRYVEVFPAREGEQEVLCLRDPLGYTDNVVKLSRSAVLILTYLDGKHTVAEVQAEIQRATGQSVTLPALEKFVRQLDESRFLESPGFAAYLLELREQFRQQPVRPAAHAGTSYPISAAALRTMLDEHYTAPTGPGLAPATTPAPVALMIPHIDPRRGGPTFAWAYAQLRGLPVADTYVVLGVAHAPTRQRFVGTNKDFQSPLGVLETDAEFMDRLAGKLAFDLYADELVHRREHSIEFQTVYLQHMLDGRRERGRTTDDQASGDLRPPTAGNGGRIAPVLVGSFHDIMEAAREPIRDKQVGAFVGALRETIAECGRRVCVIASVDLAHVGGRFGDEFTVNEGVLEELARQDREMLDCVAACDAREFLGSIYRENDRRRVDAWPAVYTMLQAVDVKHGKLLRYDQSLEPDTNSVVTFASMKFW